MGDGEMPREYIKEYVEEAETSDGNDTVHIVSLAWDKYENVTLRTTSYVQEKEEKTYKDGAKYTVATIGEEIGTVVLPLQRRELNALIRHARRARDQAFGKDE